ncbi:type IV pilus biogenesis protein PilM [Prochlorococcus sp. MIT 0801]|uniref:type IV pilus biogenesis protein PilM n=1 Tax=Prochlorococcus sp. MIT 0801 TaxID=1501269 RepID=UPI0004F78427|nr:pilus assembly protein PilM [Prochlorococcus sp. MIT 0801]AIQ97333.1 Type IV pilus bioproteinsis protein PilM [Prochlorococcus sp. MIT 0801]
MALELTENETFFGLDISIFKKQFFAFRREISKRYFLLEFGTNYLKYGEARVTNDQVFCTKINHISIDQDAIERGTPKDAEKMASFLRQIIDEEKIWARRIAITLPPEASLTKLIYLPAELNHLGAKEYVSSSSSGFQFPISLEQTDFDLIPINNLPLNIKNNSRAYSLSSIPKKLIDNVINTLEKANLELHSLDIASSSLERLALSTIENLEEKEVFILIELTNECSHFHIICKSGPIYISSLAAIKPFNLLENYEGEDSIEEAIINSKDYLPISEMDLKVLFAEIKREIDNFRSAYSLEISEIKLSGINSSHPNIKDFFEKKFKITTSILRSLTSQDIGDINLSKPICMQDLNRMIGLGLSIIQTENSDLPKSNLKEIDIQTISKNLNKSNNDISKLKIDNNNKLTSNPNLLNIENSTNNTNKGASDKSFEEYIEDTNRKNINKLSFEEFLELKKSSNKTNQSFLEQASKKFNNNNDVLKENINEVINKTMVQNIDTLINKDSSLDINNSKIERTELNKPKKEINTKEEQEIKNNTINYNSEKINTILEESSKLDSNKEIKTKSDSKEPVNNENEINSFNEIVTSEDINKELDFKNNKSNELELKESSESNKNTSQSLPSKNNEDINNNTDFKMPEI